MLSGRRKKDYAAESAAESLAAQASQMGVEPHGLTADDAGELDDDDLESTAEAEAEELTAAAA